MCKVLKTSDDWVQELDYVGLTIKDYSGWPREPSEFTFHWYEELIDKKEFEYRLYNCSLTWEFSKL